MSSTNVEMVESPIAKLTKDLKQAVLLMTPDQARYLVDSYYAIQDWRKASGEQASALEKDKEPFAVVLWLADNAEVLELEVKKALATFSKSQPIGRWAESIVGIGPVLSAGLIAHIDITRAPHPGHIWNFAGLNPTKIWERGEKRPWNAQLKTICWKIGQSFLKQSSRENCYYGKLLQQRLAWERQQNENGLLVDQAKLKLERFNIKHSTQAYLWYSGAFSHPVVKAFASSGLSYSDGEARAIPTAKEIHQMKESTLRDDYHERFSKNLQLVGFKDLQSVPEGPCVAMLPPAHILQRACRWTVKLFLSHWHYVAFEMHYGKPPALPWILDPKFGGHHDIINPPNWPMVE